ncbi:Uncharacterised protein [uncultured Bacteroides sp.]|nr:Uncharacterised protein [uncultured Bacteroides sp.]
MRVVAFLLQLAGGTQDGAGLHLGDFRISISQTTAAVTQHRVVLAEVVHTLADVFHSHAHGLGHFFLPLQVVRHELMQRRVEQTHVDRQSVHGLENFLEVGFLIRQQLVEGFLAAFHILGQNHFAHSDNLFVVEEHVFRTAESDTYGTETAGILCVARRVGIGTHFQAGVLVAEFHQFGKVARQLGRLGRDFSGIHITVGSVDGDVVAFLQHHPVDFHRTGLVVHVDGSGTGYAALTHTASYDGCMRGHTSAGGQDTFCSLHTGQVFR